MDQKCRTVNFVLQLTENVAVGVGWVVGIGIWVIRHRTVSHSAVPCHRVQCHTALYRVRACSVTLYRVTLSHSVTQRHTVSLYSVTQHNAPHRTHRVTLYGVKLHSVTLYSVVLYVLCENSTYRVTL